MRTVRGKLFLATFVVGALSALAVGLVLNVWLGPRNSRCWPDS